MSADEGAGGSAASRASAAIRLLRASLATTAILLCAVAVPSGGALLLLITPQPGLRLGTAAGHPERLLLVTIVAVVAAFAAGAPAAVFYVASFGLVTLLLPIVLEREWSLEVTAGVVTAIVAAAVLGIVFATVSPSVLASSLHAALDEVRVQAIEMYGRTGLPPDVVRDLQDGSARLVDLVLKLTPALFLLGVSAMVLLNIELLRRSQRARGLVPVFGDLTRWKCPPELVWILIASGYMTFLSGGLSEWIAMNVLAVLFGIYFCQGLAIAQFYMRRWRSPLWVVALVYVFIVVEWLVATGVTLVGVFDLWADFRRLNPRPVEED